MKQLYRILVGFQRLPDNSVSLSRYSFTMVLFGGSLTVVLADDNPPYNQMECHGIHTADKHCVHRFY